MLPILHDRPVHSAIRSRLQALTPQSPRKWGKMSVDGMLWHCNQVLRTSLGDIEVRPNKPPFPVWALKFVLFNMPWPHGAPTAPEYVAVDPWIFERERDECLALMDRFIARGLEEPWSPAVFGPMNGREWSRLQVRHLDHHLRQFSA